MARKNSNQTKCLICVRWSDRTYCFFYQNNINCVFIWILCVEKITNNRFINNGHSLGCLFLECLGNTGIFLWEIFEQFLSFELKRLKLFLQSFEEFAMQKTFNKFKKVFNWKFLLKLGIFAQNSNLHFFILKLELHPFFKQFLRG